MLKLIASDIDGTLLPPGGTSPSQELVDILTEYINAGTIIALASGRPLSGLESLFPSLKDKLIYICSNGTHIVMNGRTEFLSPLATGDSLKELMNVVRTLHYDFVVDTPEITLTETWVSTAFFQSIKAAGIKATAISDISESELPVLKISIAPPEGPFKLLETPSIACLGEKYTLVPTGGVFFDIISKTADKGTALLKIQQHFGIRPEETVVFGDAMNDVPMFSATPNSYAVETALEAVKAHAVHIVPPPDRDGVAMRLRSMFR